MPIVADWAKGTIISGVENAYSGFVNNSTKVDEVSSHITGFS
jgi:hypothetical protein